jgi:hypothetical protein
MHRDYRNTKPLLSHDFRFKVPKVLLSAFQVHSCSPRRRLRGRCAVRSGALGWTFANRYFCIHWILCVFTYFTYLYIIYIIRIICSVFQVVHHEYVSGTFAACCSLDALNIFKL